MSHPFAKISPRILIASALVLCLALVLLLWLFFKDESPNSKRDPNGPLLVLAPAGAVEAINRSGQSFSGSRTFKVQTADTERLLALFENDPQAADIVFVAGESQREALLKRGPFERVGPEPFVYDHLDAVVSEATTIELAFPQHLLQPVVKGVGYLPKSEAYGEITQALLGTWRIADRLGRRLVPCADSTEALRKLAAGELSVAFIPQSERRHLGGLKSVLNLSRHPQSAVPVFVFVSLKSPRLAEARALGEALTGPQAKAHLTESGFSPQNLTPGAR